MKSAKMNLNVWEDALDVLEKKKPSKMKLTKDMVNQRLRPEPEIIENILEALEDKIRHYYKLFTVEKKRRTDAEKNNYYLQEEIAKAYEILEKNKVYTMKMEEKLKTIKNNQGSLIDTVRRIDLLYVQLDTLVQAFAGVCTQTAIDATEDETDLSKKKHIIQMLLDYIYPCRTLDPRINALYGLLYYQTVGLLNNNTMTSPPVPPIPPAIPSQYDGWLPPSHFHLNKANVPTDLKDQSFANIVQSMHNKEKASAPSPPPGTKMQTFTNPVIKNDSFIHQNSGEGLGSKTVELLGFDIRIGTVELTYSQENPKIVCVVRYDNETAYTAIQNSKRVTKSKVPTQGTAEDHYIFTIDSTININSLPPKKAGEVPNFKIDIHDVRGKKLVGTARCSFVSERTLMKNVPWDVYSRLTKGETHVIGKIYVTILPYPSKAILPAQAFKSMKESDKFSYDTLLKNSGSLSKEEPKIGIKESQMTTLKKNTNAMLAKGESNKETKMGSKTTSIKKSAALQKTNLPPTIPINKTQSLVKKGKKVMFKPYVSKKEASSASPIPKTTEVIKEKMESKATETIPPKTNKVEPKKEETKKEEPEESTKPKITNTQMMINRFSKKAEEASKTTTTTKLAPWSTLKKNDLKKIAPKETVSSEKTSITKSVEKSNEAIKVSMKLPEEMKKEEDIKEKDEETKIKIALGKVPITKKIQFATPKKIGIASKTPLEKPTNESSSKSSISSSIKLTTENKETSSSKESIKPVASLEPKSNDSKSKDKVPPTPIIKTGDVTKKGIEIKKIMLKKEFAKNKIQMILPKTFAPKSNTVPLEVKKSTEKPKEGSVKSSSDIVQKSVDSAPKSPLVPITKKSLLNLKMKNSTNISKSLNSSTDSKSKLLITSKTKSSLETSKVSTPEITKEKPAEASVTKSILPMKTNIPLLKKANVENKTAPKIPPPSKIGKIPPKASTGPTNFEKIDSDDIEIKEALMRAKTKAIFIDKSKIKSTIIKKTIAKREIKKFVPKLKEPLV